VVLLFLPFGGESPEHASPYSIKYTPVGFIVVDPERGNGLNFPFPDVTTSDFVHHSV
jgi:hypothetical protein